MLPALYPLCLTAALGVIGFGPKQSPAQHSTQSNSDAPVYLPPGQPDAGVVRMVLGYFGEPSLLEAAKDASIRSFRLFLTCWTVAET